MNTGKKKKLYMNIYIYVSKNRNYNTLRGQKGEEEVVNYSYNAGTYKKKIFFTCKHKIHFNLYKQTYAQKKKKNVLENEHWKLLKISSKVLVIGL